LSINLDYFVFHDFEDKTYDGISKYYTLSDQFFKGNNSNDQKIQNYSASFDFSLPYSKFTLKTGGKYGKLNSTNTLQLANTGLVDLRPETLPTTINDFEYKESIRAFYTVIDPVLPNGWSLSLGSRFESIRIITVSNELSINNNKTLNNFLPTIFLTKQLKKRMSLGLSYKRTVSRPAFWALTPNPWVTNPFNQVVGNPFLLPSFSDNLEFNFAHNNFFSKVYYTKMKDGVSQIPITNESEKIVVFQFINFPAKRTMGVNLNHSWEATKWWTMNNTVDINHGIYDYEETIFKGTNTYFSTSHDLILNASKTLKMNIAFWFTPKGVDEIWTVRPQSSLSSSIQYSFLDRKLTVALRANDIFRNQYESIYSWEQNVGQDSEVYYDSRYVSFSVNYNFGNSNLKIQNKEVGNTDEIRRTGN